jgi:hypothetical protein
VTVSWNFRIFFLRIVNLGTEKKNCLYYRKQQVKRCYDKQLVHITVILRSKNIFSSLEHRRNYRLYSIFFSLDISNISASFTGISKLFWKLKIWPPVHSDAYFVMDGLCQIKCRLIDFFSADCKSWHGKKKILYYRKQQVKRCYDKQLVHITVILRSKNISFQTLQLLNTHLVNFNFFLRN